MGDTTLVFPVIPASSGCSLKQAEGIGRIPREFGERHRVRSPGATTHIYTIRFEEETLLSSTLHRRFLSGLGVAALASAGAVALSIPAAQADVSGFSTEGDLSIRTGPGTSYQEIGTISKDVQLNVQCQRQGQAIQGTYASNWWAKVTYQGKTGYVTRAFVRIPDAKGLGACPENTPLPSPPQPKPSNPVSSYEKVKARANDWISVGLLYNWDLYHPDRNGVKYRRDCSGFVSMAFDLKTSASTVTLPNYGFKKINFSELRPGDIVGNFGPGTEGANGHVAIFDGWANSAHTRFNTLEMHGPQMKGKAERSTRGTDEFWVKSAMRYTK